MGYEIVQGCLDDLPDLPFMQNTWRPGDQARPRTAHEGERNKARGWHCMEQAHRCDAVEDLPDVDTVLIPWGGGGLAGGIATAVRALKPRVRIYAVETDTGAPLAASLKAGAVQTVDYQPSLVDGIGSKTVFPDMLVMAQELLDVALTARPDRGLGLGR